MNRTKLIKEFTQAVENLAKTHDSATYHWYLDTDKNSNDWAIVLGWRDGFEKENDCYADGTWRLCAMLAYQPSNSLMQCDYDIDWMMPYDEETSEVDDNELAIYPGYDAEEIIDWLLKCYETYYTLFNGDDCLKEVI